MNTNKFNAHACAFKNESRCEEEFDQADLDLEDSESEYYEEK